MEYYEGKDPREKGGGMIKGTKTWNIEKEHSSKWKKEKQHIANDINDNTSKKGSSFPFRIIIENTTNWKFIIQ